MFKNIYFTTTFIHVNVVAHEMQVWTLIFFFIKIKFLTLVFYRAEWSLKIVSVSSLWNFINCFLTFIFIYKLYQVDLSSFFFAEHMISDCNPRNNILQLIILNQITGFLQFVVYHAEFNFKPPASFEVYNCIWVFKIVLTNKYEWGEQMTCRS